MSNLNWVDYFIIAIFAFSILVGFARGLVKEVVSLATLIAAFVVACLFSNALAGVFTNTTQVQNVMNQASSAIGANAAQTISYAALGISFGLLFAGTLIIGWIVGLVLNMVVQTGILGIGNRFLGALFGFGRGFIINLVLIFILQLTSIGESNWWHQSQLVVAYQPAVQWLGGIVSPSLANLKDRFMQTLQNVNSSVEQGISNTYQGLVK